MAGITETTARRVASRDGTQIGYWTSGEGPPLVLVHGAPADHTRWRPLLPYLEPHATVHALDRRGRGASGDGPAYHLTREFEDVAAVVDAVAEASGSPVDLYGHSFGGLCAFGAATLTASIGRLVLYEGWPPVDPDRRRLPPGVGERLDALLAAGDHDAVVETMFREVVLMPAAEVAALRAQPSWAARTAAAPPLVRELRAIPDVAFDAGQAAKIAVPTLVLTGSDSDDPFAADAEAVAAALPDARVVVLEGQRHVADVLAPELVAGHLVLVHGSLTDHTTFAPFVAELRDGLTTFSMDRRGYGASGDADGYAIEREFEDVAAVVEAVSARTGRPVTLFGHSYGAGTAMGGAALTGDLHQLVLYEPGLGIAYPAGSIEELEAAVAAGDLEAALLAVLAGIVGLPPEEVADLRAGPRWPVLLAGVPAVVRECRAEDAWGYRPGRLDGISAPALLLAGAETPPLLKAGTDRAAAAIPGSRVLVLDGHAHLAHLRDPAMVAAIIRRLVPP